MLNIIIASAAFLILVVLILMFRVQSLLAVQRGSDSNKGGLTNKVNAALFVVFFVKMTAIAIWYTFAKAEEYSLPISASKHGHETDSLFLVTMAILGIVVLLTHILLFGFAFKYQWRKDRKAKYYPDNHKLELIWTLIPAIVLVVLVFKGWKVWSNTMADIDPKKLEVARSAERENKQVVEVEAIAKQFGWEFRYPGRDGVFGRHDFRKLSLLNSVGYDFSDPENVAALDDFSSATLILPKDREVIVKIRALDVIHSFYLPHFRVKMDAVPGMPTKFRFFPEMTTLEMRAHLATLPTWNPDSLHDRATNFNYEVVCAEICGKGHYTMRGAMEVLRVDQYWDWFDAQKPFALGNQDFVMSEIESSMNIKATKSFEARLKELGELPEFKEPEEDEGDGEGTGQGGGEGAANDGSEEELEGAESEEVDVEELTVEEEVTENTLVEETDDSENSESEDSSEEE